RQLLALALATPAGCAGKPAAVIDGAPFPGPDGGPGVDGPPAGPIDARPSCNDVLPPEPGSTPHALRYAPGGYESKARLWGVLLGTGQPAPGYRIFDVDATCFLGAGTTAGPRVLDTQSRAGSRLTGDAIDLSAIPGPGHYLVVLDDGARLG